MILNNLKASKRKSSVISVGYYCFLDESTNLGVANKVKQFTDMMASMGYVAVLNIFAPGGYAPHIRMMRAIFNDNFDIIIYRLYPQSPSAFIMAGIFLIMRARGCKVIVDVPTPVSVVLRELKFCNCSSYRKILSVILAYLNIPFTIWSANRVIQYAPERGWFQFGLNRKTLLTANGVCASSFPLRIRNQEWSGDTLRIIAVSSLTEWQGFDRLIWGISSYERAHPTNKPCKIHLRIIGEGPVRAELQLLVGTLSLNHLVEFYGAKIGEDLNQHIQWADIAVGTLAAYRKGLHFASPLKHREYTARGIPFIFGCADPDFDPPPKFTLQVANDDSSINMDVVLRWVKHLASEKDLDIKIREYAINKLDFTVKLAHYLKV